MDIKTHPGVTVLYSTHRTTLNELSQFSSVSKELVAEAAAHSFVSGPVYWIYRGVDGKPGTVFTLEIAVPIQGVFKSSKFSIKELTPFKAVTHRHEGPWEQLANSYESIMQFIDSKKIPLNDEYREMYLNVDFQRPENNITEMQVGCLLN
jgi:effector-binding domain-containing protein